MSKKRSNGFRTHYISWRKTRINKIIEIFGEEYFKGKTLLELACGHGSIGREFEKMGAIVTYAEGRQKHLDRVKKRYPKAKTILLDQDAPWNLNEKFDIILHMGVLYHLENWKEDLTRTLEHSNLVILESQVIDSLSDTHEIRIDEYDRGDDQALYGIAIKTSSLYIEKHLKSLNATFVRYDDKNLNSPPHIYDWISTRKNRNRCMMSGRRFWVIRK